MGAGGRTAAPQRLHAWFGAQDNAFNYDKGVLAEILEPIMGKGLIPADLETWKPRRRAIVPAFHKAYLEAMVKMFGACTQETVRIIDDLLADSVEVCRAGHSLWVCFLLRWIYLATCTTCREAWHAGIAPAGRTVHKLAARSKSWVPCEL